MQHNCILQGECITLLRTLPCDSVDLICTDPPYGIGFAGKEWDTFKPAHIAKRFNPHRRKTVLKYDIRGGVRVFRKKSEAVRREASSDYAGHYDHSPAGALRFREWFTGISVEMLRVLKPGAFAFVCIGARQDSVSAVIAAMTEAGFKTDFSSLYWTYASGFPKAVNIGKRGGQPGAYGGFQPKPAVEVFIVAMKPLSARTFTEQSKQNDKGVTWLDDARIPTDELSSQWSGARNPHGYKENSGGDFKKNVVSGSHHNGRFPANLLVSDTILGNYSRFFSLDAWSGALPAHVRNTLPFLIIPKVSRSEKHRGTEHLEKRLSAILPLRRKGKKREGIGCDGSACDRSVASTNFHPTVKPLQVMSYLITLGSRPGDIVLDPFLGSGTTAIAAKLLGRKYIGIEREPDYCRIARARIAAHGE